MRAVVSLIIENTFSQRQTSSICDYLRDCAEGVLVLDDKEDGSFEVLQFNLKACSLFNLTQGQRFDKNKGYFSKESEREPSNDGS